MNTFVRKEFTVIIKNENMLPQFKKDFLEKMSQEEMISFNEIWLRVIKHGLQFEVTYTALEEMKSNPSSSPSTLFADCSRRLGLLKNCSYI